MWWREWKWGMGDGMAPRTVAIGAQNFEDLSIWKEETYRELQGTYPVIALSFSSVKETSFLGTRSAIYQVIERVYGEYDFLLECNQLSVREKQMFEQVSYHMGETTAKDSLLVLSQCLYKYYGKRVIILLDEYDTPMQEAYINGYWKELAAFVRGLFHSTFKVNPYLERAIMSGITQVSKESIFSDLNNLEVVTMTSEKYTDKFGFTEDEVFTALEEYGLSERRQEVKDWYDVLLEPKKESDWAYILEFKVYDPEEEVSLEDTVQAALTQIEEKK